MDTSVSGVGVLDKSMAIVAALESGPQRVPELVTITGIHRATVHRLVGALVHHGLVRRLDDGRVGLGYRFLALAGRIDGVGAIVERVRPHLQTLAEETGESAQLYVVDGDDRVCVDVAESRHGLRTIVPLGARLTLDRGSAGAVLTGRVAADEVAVSVAEREPGVASVSAAVREGDRVVAALGVSGPIERLGSDPLARVGAAVRRAAGAASLDPSSGAPDQASIETTSTDSIPPGAS